jgi:polar amino acid transport system ATP-binding protein/sulfate transport system ATP-binding protein
VTFGDTLLDVNNVSLSYSNKVILRDVNVQIQKVQRRCHVQGQVVGFLGPSGIGKTQLFRIIAGLNKPTSGQVFVNSHHDPVKAGMVGVVSQNYTLFEHHTVLGNILLGEHDQPNREEKAMRFLEQFGLEDKAHVYPAQLSGGQRQRIAIIQQLLCSQHFILMDEPTASLDLVKKEELGKLISELACLDDLNTVIIVSHDIEWVCAVSDHLWLLGRDQGMPGARIQENYNLVDLGLCWQEGITTRPDFVQFVSKVKERFRTL